MNTSDQTIAELIGGSVDAGIFRLQQERLVLISAPARIAEIDAELLVLQTEKARIDPRRPPAVVLPNVAAQTAVDATSKARIK